MSLCPIRQFRISSALDDDRELSASLQRHVDACPRCRQFLDNSRSLGKSLAAPTPVETPPWLHTKIMAKVNGTFPDEMAKESRSWFPALAGAAAIAVVATLVAVNVDPNTPAQEEVVQLSAPVTPVHPATVTARIEEHAKHALSKEVQDLAADLSGARNFLSASLRNTIPGLRGD